MITSRHANEPHDNVPRVTAIEAQADAEALARCLARRPDCLGAAQNLEVTLAAHPEAKGAGGVGPAVAKAAGEATATVASAWLEADARGERPGTAELLETATGRTASLLPRLLVRMRAARSEAAEEGRAVTRDHAAREAVRAEREAQESRVKGQDRRDSYRRPLANEPAVG